MIKRTTLNNCLKQTTKADCFSLRSQKTNYTINQIKNINYRKRLSVEILNVSTTCVHYLLFAGIQTWKIELFYLIHANKRFPDLILYLSMSPCCPAFFSLFPNAGSFQSPFCPHHCRLLISSSFCPPLWVNSWFLKQTLFVFPAAPLVQSQ